MVRFGILGLGYIGTEIVREMISDGNELVFAVDKDSSKAGRRLDELISKAPQFTVVSDIREANTSRAELCIIATSSRLADVFEQVIYLAEKGLNVLSTCEELAYPYATSTEIAEKINSVALRNSVSVLGAGVNPGFIMDLVPSLLAIACRKITRIRITRSVDVSKRRSQLRAKLGIGLRKERVRKCIEQGSAGHVGLRESAYLIAASLGKKIEKITSWFNLLGSEEYCTGIEQELRCSAEDTAIELHLEMSIFSADYDLIEVEGIPSIKARFENGVSGDSATVSIICNLASRIQSARKGLLTVLDLPFRAPQTNAFTSSLTKSNSVTSSAR